MAVSAAPPDPWIARLAVWVAPMSGDESLPADTGAAEAELAKPRVKMPPAARVKIVFLANTVRSDNLTFRLDVYYADVSITSYTHLNV
jgi:hypothetical protein